MASATAEASSMNRSARVGSAERGGVEPVAASSTSAVERAAEAASSRAKAARRPGSRSFIACARGGGGTRARANASARVRGGRRAPVP